MNKIGRLYFHIFTAISLLCISDNLKSDTDNTYPIKMIINVPVANLRELPQANAAGLKIPTNDFSNPLQLTQILLGEHVIAHEDFIDESGKKWFKVNTLQQEYFYPPLGWHGYPGWIQADEVLPVKQYAKHNLVVRSMQADLVDQNHKKIYTISMGTRLIGTKFNNNLWKVILPDSRIAFIKNTDVYHIEKTIQESAEQLRTNIIATALQFLGNFYSWGGRSAQIDGITICSVDCSSLINLSFLAYGLQIPRMSHEQFLRSERIEHGKDLQPGDLIFFITARKHSTRMDHVLIYLGNDLMLETTYLDNHKARIISFQDRLGTSCNNLKSGDIVDNFDPIDTFHVFFGSFLNDPKLLQTLRDDALRHIY